MDENKTLENSYAPIDCSFHDQLLELATFKSKVEFVYLDQENRRVSIIDIATDVYTSKSKEEYLVLSSGVEIRLDRLVLAGKFNPTKN